MVMSPDSFSHSVIITKPTLPQVVHSSLFDNCSGAEMILGVTLKALSYSVSFALLGQGLGIFASQLVRNYSKHYDFPFFEKHREKIEALGKKYDNIFLISAIFAAVVGRFNPLLAFSIGFVSGFVPGFKLQEEAAYSAQQAKNQNNAFANAMNNSYIQMV